MASALIRRSPSNVTRQPGTTSGTVLSSGVLDLAKITIGKGGSTGTTNLKATAGRTNKQVFTPTQAQKNVITPQQVIGGNIITIEQVTGNYQTGQVNVQYSQKPVSALSVQKQSPIVKTVSNVGQAASVSKLLGRTVEVGEGLTAADVARINTPGAATGGVGAGFKGGAGFGQVFPINEEIYKLAQQAVDISRIKTLATKAAYSVSTSASIGKSISFSGVSVAQKAPATISTPKKVVKDLSLAIKGFYK